MEPPLRALLAKFSVADYIYIQVSRIQRLGPFFRQIIGMLDIGFGPVAEFCIRMATAGVCLRADLRFYESHWVREFANVAPNVDKRGKDPVTVRIR